MASDSSKLGKKKSTRDGQSRASRLAQISANAAATLSPHANYPIHLFFVQTSNPFPCFFKSFSGATGIFLWNCAWTVSLFHWTTSRQGWVCSKTISPLIVSLLIFLLYQSNVHTAQVSALHQTLMWLHCCKGAQAVVFLPYLRGVGFYRKNPEKPVHARSLCWVFLENSVFSVCEIKPCLNLANKERLGKLIGP